MISHIMILTIIYKLNIDFEIEDLKIFTNLNNFEKWILNPNTFNYKDFDSCWLLDFNQPIYLNRLKENKNITNALYLKLNETFNSELASIKFKYFKS